jgi:hypothetical protein
MRHILLKIAAAAGVVLLQTSIGFACTCAPKRTVLDEYEWAPVVVIARVVSVENAEKKDKRDYQVQLSRLVVEKIYKGDVRIGDELRFVQGDGMNCLIRFSETDIGNRLLLYTGVPRDGEPLAVSFCGRSGGVKRATEDLLYLDKIDQVRGKTRVSGRYEGAFYRGELKVAGRKIRIVGEGDTYETTTDENGVFELYGLPPGNYRLEPELQPGFKIERNYLSVSGDVLLEQSTETYVAFTLKPQRHVSIELRFREKDEVRGGEARPK